MEIYDYGINRGFFMSSKADKKVIQFAGPHWGYITFQPGKKIPHSQNRILDAMRDYPGREMTNNDFVGIFGIGRDIVNKRCRILVHKGVLKRVFKAAVIGQKPSAHYTLA